MDRQFNEWTNGWENSNANGLILLSINVDPFYISFKWTDWFINGQMCDV